MSVDRGGTIRFRETRVKKVGWNDRMDDGDDLSNLPPEAMGNTFDVEGSVIPPQNRRVQR